MRLALLLALLALPGAAAADVLASQEPLGAHEARLLVRTRSGAVRVDAEPPVRVAGVAPGADAAALAETPATLEAPHTWRGIERVVELVLRREDPSVAVALILDEGGNTGVWVEWPAAPRERDAVPSPAALAFAAVVAGALAARKVLSGSSHSARR